MLYNCCLNQCISGIVSQCLILDPKDYLYCESMEELEQYIKDDLRDSINYGDICEDILDNKYDIPKEFFVEWKKLKDNE